jgi:methyl-accepting chemotaxis protein
MCLQGLHPYRAAHGRIYSTLMEKGDAGVSSGAALKSAQMTYDRSLKYLDDYAKLPDVEGQDPAIKTDSDRSARP